MDTATAVAVILALSGYLITYWINLRTEQHKRRLDRVNRQLKELYGPMFTLTQASDRSWRRFKAGFVDQFAMVDGSMFEKGEVPSDEKLQMWRLWMETVFRPINRELYRLIQTHGDLLIESEMPDCLQDLCAHVAAAEVLFKRWETADYSEYRTAINYPNEIIQYSINSFVRLKTRQAKLLGED